MKQVLSVCLSAAILGGCVSVLPEPSVPGALYRLPQAASLSAASQAELLASVTVFEPEGSALLLGRSIVFEDDLGALSVLADAQWSDPAALLLQSFLVDRLTLLKAADGAIVVSDQSGAVTDVEFKWRVKDFVILEDEARFAVQVTLLGARTRQIAGQFDISETVSYAGTAETDGVRALQQAAMIVIDQISADLPKHLDQSALEAVSRRR